MRALSARPVSEGIALGILHFIEKEEDGKDYRDKTVSDPQAEIGRLDAACEQACAELMSLSERALSASGEEAADIFMVHSMMLQDEDFVRCMHELIAEKSHCAEYAVFHAASIFAQALGESGSGYIAERGSDVADVSRRVVRILSGKAELSIEGDEPCILAAEELTPSQTLLFDRSRLLALVSERGSPTSHTAILARSLGIPALILSEQGVCSSFSGRRCVADGFEGVLYLDADDKTCADAERRRVAWLEEEASLEGLKDSEACTKSGRKVRLFGNAGSIEDVAAAVEKGGEGIGLFRSEFLYLGRSELPSEEELLRVYAGAVKELGGRPLIIRTLDVGADKTAPCLPMAEEANPALGLRAIRLCFARPDVFRTQLRALLRAAAEGPLSVMFPMIISVSEVLRAKQALTEAMQELTREGLPCRMPDEIGIMIETPAAAMISDDLAREVDFFSIGTNDLTQYTLAADRQNEALADCADPRHEAVLRLIELTAKNAHAAGIWVGICGELASDTVLLERFLSAGIDELSLNPASILKVKKQIRELA